VSAIPLSTRDELVSVDPATLDEVGRVPVTETAALGEIVSEARLAQRAWAGEPLEARARLLRSVAHALLEDADEIAATIVRETGKPVVEAYTSELFVCLDNLAWLAANLGKVLQRERIPVRQPYLPHKRAWLHHEPIGVVGIVSAWNFPLGVPLTQAASAVAAGCGPCRAPERRSATLSCGNVGSASSSSPARPKQDGSSPRGRRSASARSRSSSEARTRCSSSTTPISTAR
jgi:acyl-CoA reductase-like NAD-dependent aldehyde dehydrogenase